MGQLVAVYETKAGTVIARYKVVRWAGSKAELRLTSVEVRGKKLYGEEALKFIAGNRLPIPETALAMVSEVHETGRGTRKGKKRRGE